MIQAFKARAHKRVHTKGHIDRKREIALLMIGSGLARVVLWAILCTLYIIGAAFAVKLFRSVSFVAFLSVLALLLTDWGQVAASLAQLTAGDVHQDVAATKKTLTLGFEEIESDIARLAQLQPSPEADELATHIRERLRGDS